MTLSLLRQRLSWDFAPDLTDRLSTRARCSSYDCTCSFLLLPYGFTSFLNGHLGIVDCEELSLYDILLCFDPLRLAFFESGIAYRGAELLTPLLLAITPPYNQSRDLEFHLNGAISSSYWPFFELIRSDFFACYSLFTSCSSASSFDVTSVSYST